LARTLKQEIQAVKGTAALDADSIDSWADQHIERNGDGTQPKG
jgi:hypothetical protein